MNDNTIVSPFLPRAQQGPPKQENERKEKNVPSSLLKQPPRTIGDLLVRVSAHGVSGLLLDEVESWFYRIVSSGTLFFTSDLSSSSGLGLKEIKREEGGEDKPLSP